MKFVLRLVFLYLFSLLTEGKEYTLPYHKNGGECRNTFSEYSPTNSDICCSRCKPGFRLLRQCTASSDTVCEACKEGTFSSAMNYHTNCFSCSVCNPNKHLVYTKHCTRVSNSECECKPGWYCVSHLSNEPCSQCKKRPTCPPGKGPRSAGSQKCVDCAKGTFSNVTSSEPCQPHTQCEAEGMTVLHAGSATHDTVCKPEATTIDDPPTTTTATTIPATTTTAQTTPLQDTVPPLSASDLNAEPVQRTTTEAKHPLNSDNTVLYSVIGGVAAVILLVVLLTCFVIRHRKGLRKPPVKEDTRPEQALHSKMETERLLEHSKASSSSGSSTSSTPDSHSQSTGASQDNIHAEQPLVSSPCVNISFTATINCQMNQPQGSCSIPICSPTQLQPQLLTQPHPQPEPETEPHPPAVPSDLPLSQEEQLCVSCEEENSKDALQSVQESGMTVC